MSDIPTVFISYSHDSTSHAEKVLELSERLRIDGIPTSLDQYVKGTPEQGWPRWMLDQFDEAAFVLVICSEIYYRRFRGHQNPGLGKGADFEGAIITQEIYVARSRTTKFVPVMFSSDHEPFIPEPLRSQTHYTLTSEESYRALYDFLLDQAGIEPVAVGEPKRRLRSQGRPATFDQASDRHTPEIAPSRLPRGADHLFGRDEELEVLDHASRNPATHVLTIVAWGGIGKTSLVFEWMARQSAAGWRGFERVFDWSFFSQGTREQGGGSADSFVSVALKFFGDAEMAGGAGSPWDKGARLATLVAERPTLLVLDGLEPLQFAPGPLQGVLKDPAMDALLKGLARRNPGLCIVTTRQPVNELGPFRDTTAPVLKLESLSATAAVELLKKLGVTGALTELRRLVDDLDGHALTLELMGRYLSRAHGGDIRKRDRVQFEHADRRVQGGQAFKAMAAYEEWLSTGGEDGARQLAVLRLMGLFNRPANAGCIAALRRGPAIERLTEPLVGLDEAEWNLTLSALSESDLISVLPNPDVSQEPSTIDVHALIREYFGSRLREQEPSAWQQAHSRLYEHLKDNTRDKPNPTLEDLEPLYQAVFHGCEAGLYEDARLSIYHSRILRNDNYSTKRLGAYGADLALVGCFFETPWTRLAPGQSHDAQARLPNQAGYCLRALGRLSEAIDPMVLGLAADVLNHDWRNAAISAGNLSVLRLVLGDLSGAVTDAEQAVAYTIHSGDVFLHVVQLTEVANSMHQAGHRAEALERFVAAEQLHAKNQPEDPLLFSIRGFYYCDLLLAPIERAMWHRLSGVNPNAQPLLTVCHSVERRALKALNVAKARRFGPLSKALDCLTLGRVGLYALILESSDADRRRSALEYMQTAVDCMRSAGAQHWIPSALLTRAWLRSFEGEADGAYADLDEAWEIAARGPMRLHMADIHLHRARLFRDKSELAKACKMIQGCGYWRRKEEVEDAEEAAKKW